MAPTEGRQVESLIQAAEQELELWDYKATRYDKEHILQYVKQMLTYAYIYERTQGGRPGRCVLFFIKECPSSKRRFLVIDASDVDVNRACFEWTLTQIREIEQSKLVFEANPGELMGGDSNDALASDVAQNQCII